ncbi:hypothetical protein AVEN_52539-1 [Araneus ventricosus]|uniref:Uncharacterized protein n=1 Tax=Araneus ventricosus TaxID=182803 RepID=A0A4Y2KKI5_ARAVE|nr:hypothetical protein AVEN_52539-1 [Araneus ventricosus]
MTRTTRTLSGTHSPNFHAIPERRRLNPNVKFNVHAGSSVESSLNMDFNISKAETLTLAPTLVNVWMANGHLDVDK